MGSPARVIRTVVKRLERLERIRALMAANWELIGERKLVVRRDDVVNDVASHLNEDIGDRLRTAVLLLAKQLGWKPIKYGNRRLFACVKRRGSTIEQARDSSVLLRRSTR